MDPGSRTSDVLTRAGLILTATGVLSTATVRYVTDESNDTVLAWGFLLYLGLLLLATPRRQHRRAPLIALLTFTGVYLSDILTATPLERTGLGLYVIAAVLAYRISPVRFRALAVAAFALWTPALRFFGPDPFTGAYPVSVAIASVLALFFLVAVLLAPGASDEEERVRRIGLGLLAVACVDRISERHFVVATANGIAPDDVWALVVILVLPILLVAKLRRPTRDALATGIALGTYVLVGLALILGKGYHVDTVAVTHRATQIVLEGHDPYHGFDSAEALRHFGLDPALGTSLQDGTELRSFNYPALAFLVPAPFVAAGLTDIRFLYLGEIVAFLLVLVRQVRVPWRPLVTAAVVGNAVIVRQNVLAGVDPLWAILTAFAFLFFGRRTWSPILLGLAAAARQPAWFFIPFYLVLAWRSEGRRAALRRTALIAVAGGLPNLPFFLLSPGDFLAGIVAPMVGALEPYGVGLIRFAMDGGLPLFPRGVYGVLAVVAMLLLLGVCWRRWRELPTAPVVFASVILWFAWRSLQNYFSFAGVFAMVGVDEVVIEDAPTVPT